MEEGLILCDKSGSEIALLVREGFDFPWDFGRLRLLEVYAEYQPLFHEVEILMKKAEAAGERDDEAEEERLLELRREKIEQLNDMPFQILGYQAQIIVEYH